MLAPAPPDAPVQFIDVRDLGEWIVRAIESSLSGVYNATGEPITFVQLLDECRRVSGDAEVVWVPPERLVEAGVGEWMELPLWIVSPEFAAMQRANVSKAMRAGLRTRRSRRRSATRSPGMRNGKRLAPRGLVCPLSASESSSRMPDKDYSGTALSKKLGAKPGAASSSSSPPRAPISRSASRS